MTSPTYQPRLQLIGMTRVGVSVVQSVRSWFCPSSKMVRFTSDKNVPQRSVYAYEKKKTARCSTAVCLLLWLHCQMFHSGLSIAVAPLPYVPQRSVYCTITCRMLKSLVKIKDDKCRNHKFSVVTQRHMIQFT